MNCFSKSFLTFCKWFPFLLSIFFTSFSSFLPNPKWAFFSGFACMFFTYPGLLTSVSELSISELKIKLQKNISIAHKLNQQQAKHVFRAIAYGSNRMSASEDKFLLQEVNDRIVDAKEIEDALREVGFSGEEISRDKRIVHAYNLLDLFDMAWEKLKSDTDEKINIKNKRQEISREIMYQKLYSESISNLVELVNQIKTISTSSLLNDFLLSIRHFEKYLLDHKKEL